MNRSSFQCADKYVPSRVIERGTGPVWELSSDANLRLGELAVPYRNGPTSLSNYLCTTNANAFVVVHQGRLAWEWYRTPDAATSLHLGQSVSKSILGLTVGTILDAAALRADSEIIELVPELAGTAWADTSVRDCLDMTTRVEFVEDYGTAFDEYDAACGWHASDGVVGEGFLEFVASLRRRTARTPVFNYISPATDVLGLAVQRACGEPLSAVISRHLWARLGAEAAGRLAVDARGHAVISGGFMATARDYARVGQMILDRGEVLGTQLLSSEWVDALGAGGPSDLHLHPRYGRLWTDGSYAAGWWMGRGWLMARGIYGQLLAIHRSASLVVVVAGAWDQPASVTESRSQLDVIDALRRSLGS